MTRWPVTLTITVALLAVALLAAPLAAEVQQPTATVGADPAARPSRWEISLDGQVGVPRGYVQVGENHIPGSHLRLHEDLGIDVSEAVEAQVRYHLTPKDALRATFLYYFLDGSTTTRREVAYNGQIFSPGRLDTNSDFYRINAAYERHLLTVGDGARLTGSVGLTYVHLNPKVGGNAEDFYLQELPTPFLGVRVDAPLGRRFGVTGFLEGGGLPRVDSGRKEGGTVFISQQHADAGLALTYALTPVVQLHAGYRFTYLRRREKSHEDDNAFKLIDNGLQAGIDLRF